MNEEFNDLDVLLIEDNPADVFLLKQMLLDTPLALRKIYEFDRIDKGCAFLKENKVQLILLDLSLPDSSGLETLVSVQQAAAKIPIIILTGLNDTAVALQAIQGGAKDYLVKGEFDKNILLRAIQYTLEKNRLEKNLEHMQKVKGQQITIAVLAAQERERIYIGGELHDNINQTMASIKLYISAALNQPEIREQVLLRAFDHVTFVMEEIRKLSKKLISPGIKTGSLLVMVQTLLDDLAPVSSLQFDLDIVVNETLLRDDLKIGAYRMMQEQINNIVKHAQASEVSIQMFVENKNLVIITTDNGKGFDLFAWRDGMGITNMINRAETLNGAIEFHTFPGKGCSIEITIPLNFQRATTNSKNLSSPGIVQD